MQFFTLHLLPYRNTLIAGLPQSMGPVYFPPACCNNTNWLIHFIHILILSPPHFPTHASTSRVLPLVIYNPVWAFLLIPSKGLNANNSHLSTSSSYSRQYWVSPLTHDIDGLVVVERNSTERNSKLKMTTLFVLHQLDFLFFKIKNNYSIIIPRSLWRECLFQHYIVLMVQVMHYQGVKRGGAKMWQFLCYASVVSAWCSFLNANSNDGTAFSDHHSFFMNTINFIGNMFSKKKN